MNFGKGEVKKYSPTTMREQCNEQSSINVKELNHQCEDNIKSETENLKQKEKFL